MTHKQLEEYLLSKLKSRIDYPFDDVTPVFKVFNKMFALVSTDENPLRINLKCDPADAEALRGMYRAIIPGYHMNKRHWNTIILDDTVPAELLYELIDHSYDLVVKTLKKSEREQLNY
jgi:predicted DNA-binding protein (MmcQ/YjbR family)